MSSRGESNASSVEQVDATIEEMSKGIARLSADARGVGERVTVVSTTVVAMSRTTGGSWPAGTAIAIGLVLSRLSAAPQAGMWLALATAE